MYLCKKLNLPPFKTVFLNYSLVKKLNFIIFAFGFNLIKMKERPLNRIKVVLVENQKTSKWLAEQLGVSAVTVSKWCTNMHQPDLQTLAKIAELVGCEKES